MASGTIGLAALRHAEHDLTLTPQVAFLFPGEMYRRLDPPALDLRNLPFRQRPRRQSRAPAAELARGLLQFAVAFERNQGPGRAGGEKLLRLRRRHPLRAQRNEQQGFLDTVEFQQMHFDAEHPDHSLRADRAAPFHGQPTSPRLLGTGLPADDERRLPQTEGHEDETVAVAAAGADDLRILLVLCRGALCAAVAPAKLLDEIGGFHSLAQRILGPAGQNCRDARRTWSPLRNLARPRRIRSRCR